MWAELPWDAGAVSTCFFKAKRASTSSTQNSSSWCYFLLWTSTRLHLRSYLASCRPAYLSMYLTTCLPACLPACLPTFLPVCPCLPRDGSVGRRTHRQSDMYVCLCMGCLCIRGAYLRSMLAGAQYTHARVHTCGLFASRRILWHCIMCMKVYW